MKTTTYQTTLSELIDSLNSQLEGETEQDEWLSPQQIAGELGMHINTIYRIIQSGQLTVYDLTVGHSGKTYYRIRRSDFEDWLEGRRR